MAGAPGRNKVDLLSTTLSPTYRRVGVRAISSPRAAAMLAASETEITDQQQEMPPTLASKQGLVLRAR
jgi:hypothetical protein